MLKKLISAVAALLIVSLGFAFAFKLGGSGEFKAFTDKLLNYGGRKNGVTVNVYEIFTDREPSFTELIGADEKEVIKSWFAEYHRVLGELPEKIDSSKPFIAFWKLYQDHSPNLEGDILTLRRLTAARRRCALPLTFSVCDVGLRPISAAYADSALLEIRVEECFAAVFDGFPENMSTYAGIEHFFSLEKDGDSWYVRRHKSGSAFAKYTVSGDKYAGEYADYAAAKPKTPAFPYDRAKAVSYAAEYTDREKKLRNPVFRDYEDNSANFVSQCVLAGGIPEDYIWNKETEAFYGGDEFFGYVSSDYGIAAGACDYSEAESGDIIQFLDLGGKVITSSLIVGEYKGEYLVSGNSDDFADFPAAAAGFDEARIIKVYGYE